MTKCNLITRKKMSNSFLSKIFFFSDSIHKGLPCMNYIQCFKAHSNLSVFQWSSFGVLYKPSKVTLSNCHEPTWCMSKPHYSELVTRHLSSKKTIVNFYSVSSLQCVHVCLPQQSSISSWQKAFIWAERLSAAIW